MYKIGELSKLSNIPVKTLRFYDAEGILPPDKIDEFTGYRYYNAAKLSDCYRILALKELGFSLSEIKNLFKLPKENISELISAKEKEIENQIAQAESRINTLRKLNSSLKENESMFDIVITKSDELRLAYDRRIVKCKTECDSILCNMQLSLPKEIIGNRMVIIDYETEFVDSNFDTGFGVEITNKLPKSSKYSEKTIRFTSDTASLICTHKEYDTAVRYLNKYVLDNNYQIVGPTYKIIYEDNTIEIKLPIVKLCKYSDAFNEDINISFINDEEVIGRWELFDFLPSKDMFNPQKSKLVESKDLVKELYFLPKGEKYWCFGWTKGLLLSNCGYPHRRSQNKYTIQKIGKETFLFIEFKAHSYFEGGKPEIWVFKKTDSKEYSKREIMIVDEIPNIPADDKNVVGSWSVCDLVRSTDSFDPQNMCSFIPYDALYWRNAEFLSDGAMINTFKNYEETESHTDPAHIWRWINGYVICNPRNTASKYIIQKHNDIEYLFIQWKSGDYSFGGEEPFWYVFKRGLSAQ